MRRTIRLGFRTESGTMAYINIPSAPAIVPTGVVVKQAMDAIVGTNIVNLAAGPLASPANARHTGVEAVTFVF